MFGFRFDGEINGKMERYGTFSSCTFIPLQTLRYYENRKFSCNFKVCKSVHHHTVVPKPGDDVELVGVNL